MRKRKIFQFEKGKFSYQKNENIPLERKIFQLVKRKYFQFEFGNWEMAEEQEQEDKNKCIRP